MTIEEALRAFLLTLQAVTDITTTIRPDELATGDTLPALTITVEEEEDQNDLSGAGGLINATIVISALSQSKAQARALSSAVKLNGTDPGTGLAGYSGLAGDLRIDCYHNSRASIYATEDDDSDDGLHSVDSIYTVWYQEQGTP